MAQIRYLEKTPESKRRLRQEALKRRDAQDPAVALGRARLAQAALVQTPVWRAARTVALFMPIKGEPDTSLLQKNAFGTGKTIFLPKIMDARNSVMEFFARKPDSKLIPGRWGILEPPEGETPERLDLVVAPGLAFDRQGGRLGYGCGYYDKYFAARRQGAIIGLCYSLQIVDRVPQSQSDVRVNGVCCEDGLLWA